MSFYDFVWGFLSFLIIFDIWNLINFQILVSEAEIFQANHYSNLEMWWVRWECKWIYFEDPMSTPLLHYLDLCIVKKPFCRSRKMQSWKGVLYIVSSSETKIELQSHLLHPTSSHDIEFHRTYITSINEPWWYHILSRWCTKDHAQVVMSIHSMLTVCTSQPRKHFRVSKMPAWNTKGQVQDTPKKQNIVAIWISSEARKYKCRYPRSHGTYPKVWRELRLPPSSNFFLFFFFHY